MTESEFESFYKEHLEEDIIFKLSERNNISIEKAMDIYYSSKLANQIYDGEYGVQYLDCSVLVNVLEGEIK